VTPTAVGKALIARAKVVEAELRQARNDIETVRGAGAGEIRVSASPTVAMGLLPNAIVGFKRTRPKVSFQIQEGSYPDVLPAVRTGELDFAICLVPGRPRDEALEFKILLRISSPPPCAWCIRSRSAAG
jgi:DNA-binding transcriptional LysR family regulator